MPSPFNSKVENLPRHAYFGLITFGAELMNPRRRRKGLLRPSVLHPFYAARSNQIRVALGKMAKTAAAKTEGGRPRESE